MTQQSRFWGHTQEKWTWDLHRHLYAHAHSSVIHNSRRQAQPQHPWADGQTDEEDVVRPDNRLLFSLKKGRTFRHLLPHG